MLAGVLVLVVVVVAAIGIVAKDVIGLTRPTNGVALPGRATLVTDGISNIFLLPADSGKIALVDCGNDHQAKAVIAALQARGLSSDSVEVIFLTHGHFDHIGGCGMFPNAKIMAMAPDVGLIEGTAKANSPLMNLIPQTLKPTGLKVARALHDDETVILGPLVMRAFAVPGHTAGSAVYLARGVLYLGDTASMDSSGNLRNSVWAFSADAAQAKRSLQVLAAKLAGEGTAVQAVAPGHSAPGPGSALARFAAAS